MRVRSWALGICALAIGFLTVGAMESAKSESWWPALPHYVAPVPSPDNHAPVGYGPFGPYGPNAPSTSGLDDPWRFRPRTQAFGPYSLWKNRMFRLPDSAFARSTGIGRENTISLIVQVRADGSVGDIKLSAASGSQFFDDDAKDDLRKWKFTPATQDGKPIDDTVQIDLYSRLRPVATLNRLDDIPNINDATIFSLLGNISATPGKYRELLQALHDGNWQPAILSADYYWFDFTNILVERKEIEAAKSVSRRIRNPYFLALLKIDKRFDAITSANPAQFDMAKATTLYLDDMRARAKNNPDSLQAMDQLIEALIRTAHFQEALTFAEATLLELAKPDAGRFADRLGRNSILDARMRALFHLRRGADAARQLEEAVRPAPKSLHNYQELINLAHLLNALGWPLDTLQTITVLDERYSRKADARYFKDRNEDDGERVQILACAFHGLKGDEGILDKEKRIADAMAFFRTRTNYGPFSHINALLCQGSIEPAAKILIEQLRKERWRLDALFFCQNLASARTLEAKNEPQWKALCARPDVVQAINLVGRVGDYPMLAETIE